MSERYRENGDFLSRIDPSILGNLAPHLDAFNSWQDPQDREAIDAANAIIATSAEKYVVSPQRSEILLSPIMIHDDPSYEHSRQGKENRNTRLRGGGVEIDLRVTDTSTAIVFPARPDEQSPFAFVFENLFFRLSDVMYGSVANIDQSAALLAFTNLQVEYALGHKRGDIYMTKKLNLRNQTDREEFDGIRSDWHRVKRARASVTAPGRNYRFGMDNSAHVHGGFGWIEVEQPRRQHGNEWNADVLELVLPHHYQRLGMPPAKTRIPEIVTAMNTVMNRPNPEGMPPIRV